MKPIWLAWKKGDLDSVILGLLDLYRDTRNPDVADVLDEVSLQRIERVGGWGEHGKALEKRFAAGVSDLDVPAAAAALVRLPGHKAARILSSLPGNPDTRRHVMHRCGLQ